MKILKYLLIFVASVIAIFLIAALFINGEYSSVREVTINKSKDQVFEYVKYLKNQDHFSKWAQMDPNMKKEYRGTDATVGFVSAWDSETDSVGKGEQEIIAITPGERIDYELRFFEPFEAKDHAYMTTVGVGDNQTRVTWGFDGKMPYPMNFMMIFMDMDAMLGPDLQKGLDNLKTVLESQQ